MQNNGKTGMERTGMTDTREIIVETGALSQAPSMFSRHFPGMAPRVIADINTFRVAGETVSRLLQAEFPDIAPPVILEEDPVLRPTLSRAEEITSLLEESSCIAVAVGSGTINDIVKLASDHANRSYLVVGTAASMDGYGSFGASMLANGYKQTIPCAAPRAVLADVTILTGAPVGMNESGYADLIGKLTAGADWIVADAVGIEPIRQDIWDMVQIDLKEWISRPEAVRLRDSDAITKLFQGLAASAFAMQRYQNTRPASGSEHLFSHVWEMEHLSLSGVPVSHGFKVGIGTLATSALLETLFDIEMTQQIVEKAIHNRLTKEERGQEIAGVFGETPYADAVTSAGVEKHVTGQAHERIVQTAYEKWGDLRRKIELQVPRFEEVKSHLQIAGCPAALSEIGVSQDRFITTIRKAQMIRPRYTTLDLIYDLGLVDRCIDTMMSSGKYL